MLMWPVLNRIFFFLIGDVCDVHAIEHFTGFLTAGNI